jgi:hypothetical protein
VNAATGPTGSFSTRWRHDAAVDPAALIGEPLDDVGAGQHLPARLGERLALLHGQQPRDRVDALADQARRGAHHRGALVRGHEAPSIEAAPRRGQREIEVGGRRVGHATDALAGGRVDHVERLGARRVSPLVVDEQAGVGIGGISGHAQPRVELPSSYAEPGRMGTARPRILPLDIASTLGATGRGGRGAALTAMGLAGEPPGGACVRAAAAAACSCAPTR